MALVTISGYPCSGKTTRAKELEALFKSQIPLLPVTIVNEEMLNLEVDAYDNTRSEKPSRANLLSATIRSLSKDRITICDAMNYIKGFRYQLYCAAREAGCRTLTIHVAAPDRLCREWNEKRTSRKYAPETLDNLISRFEEPSFATRWDSPLIVIPWSDTTLPQSDIVSAVLKGELKPPNLATVHSTVSTSDYLQRLDSITASVVNAVVSAQSMQPGGGQLSIGATMPEGKTFTSTIKIPPNTRIGLPQLQRHRRQYLQVSKQANGQLSSDTIAQLFVDYLHNALQ